MKAVAQLLALALVAGLLGLLIWKVTSDENPARVGDPAPDFELPLLRSEGKNASLATYDGTVRVVNFWASWCGPCRDEAPLLERAWKKHRDDGVVVLGVDTRDFVSDGTAFLREFEITYPNVHDGRGEQAERYGVAALPETFVLDADGEIVAHFKGAVDDAAELEAVLAQAQAG